MSKRRSYRVFLSDDEEEEDKFYKLKVLLPNSTSVTLALTNPESEMPMENFVNLVIKEYEKCRQTFELSGKKRKQVDWNRAVGSYLDFNGDKISGIVRFEMFKPDVCNIIRLFDGSGEASILYENMWDLTPDTDLLKYRHENYCFDTAFADLIALWPSGKGVTAVTSAIWVQVPLATWTALMDNSLQAVWSCSPGEQRLISVDVRKDRISIFDSGPGMDSSEENSIAKWGTLGASVHRSHKSKGLGGNPPYLTPVFGTFGCGGAYSCMHLGRRTMVSSKTKLSKMVFTLQLNEDELIARHLISATNWKVDGGMRDPLEEESMLSPHGSFTKVEIFEPRCDIPEINQLRWRLKDIYFPYIQNDEISKTGRTVRPVGFKVNGVDLAEVLGGEVATTNLNSRGEEFSFQIRFTEKREGTSQEANARLKFVYFPVIQGKESNDIILESLEKEGFQVSESFTTFGRVSVRRLGRLLPEVPWVSIPFMDRGANASTLQRCCQRVKCFVDLDAGFTPSPSKNDLASQNHFSVALRNFGSRSKEKDNDVSILIHRVGILLSYAEVEQSYQEWVLNMHTSYDQEHASGEDDAIVIFHSLDNKSLGISPDCKAVRLHNVVKRKGTSWERGQKIRILKGACSGPHKSDVYATIDYFIIEKFEDETRGDAKIICR
ncbi:unnamed protein product [Microthlaspi erraticum]|uniref:Uncharacterized protein n=1 Tax=Microthlaspi erraticum TaxID=1685480 RepID=A0A6D2IDH8_9BRAS|nr:unnamed protein product [Microthlaspi erraticum]